MKPTFNDKLLAYLVLFSGLAISGVAEYYSIMGLIAIYPAAFIPIVVMGVVLGFGKISATVWLKQNWQFAPWFLKTYILPAIVVLMVITSLGVFGFLSKAHSDQSLVSGDVQSKIAVYDTKIQTAKDNIDANRKALKQMDEAVDQVMGRSSDEKGADKAVSIRRSQQKERARLQSEIASEQKTIAAINEERAPIAAEVRKVEAEVGPIKYIAHLLYGENPDANILEKAVIWVTVLIVIVLDPLAVILLLAAQYSFQRFRDYEDELAVDKWFEEGKERARELDKETALGAEVADVISAVPEAPIAEGDSPTGPVVDVVSPEPTVTVQPIIPYEIVSEDTGEVFEVVVPQPELSLAEQHPYLNKPFVHFTDLQPMVSKVEEPEVVEEVTADTTEVTADTAPEILTLGIDEVERPGDYVTPPTVDDHGIDWANIPPNQEYIVINGERMQIRAARDLYGPKHLVIPGYVQNEEQTDTSIWNKVISEQEYRNKAEENLQNELNNNINNAP